MNSNNSNRKNKTRLEIETPEEFEVARVAIEAHRATAVRHVGRYASRMDVPCHSTDCERAFSDEWQKENNPSSGVNFGIGVLMSLLHREDKPIPCVPFHREFDGDVTPKEARDAATVIQWLGTNCGFAFVTRCIEACGYKVVYQPKKESTTGGAR